MANIAQGKKKRVRYSFTIIIAWKEGKTKEGEWSVILVWGDW